MTKESETQAKTDKKTRENVKTHKAFGVFNKHSNPSIMGMEREFIAEAISEKYVK